MSKRPYALVGKDTGVARSRKEIFVTYYAKYGVKCTQTCNESV
jgi:hypothetical protein